MKIDREGFIELIDRVRTPLYNVRDDIKRGRITSNTEKEVNKIYDFLEEVKDESTGWQIWENDFLGPEFGEYEGD